jgi:hypothetical protein
MFGIFETGLNIMEDDELHFILFQSIIPQFVFHYNLRVLGGNIFLHSIIKISK